jgi:8-oxo-dGTP pyrophosphatase MutT (NUDIX family)
MRGAQRYWRWTRGLTLGAQGAVFDADGRVLLIRHTYRPGWHFPGGGVEMGESALAALGRELHEEAGVVLGPTVPQLLGIYTNFTLFPSDHVVVYVVRDWTRPVIPPPNREIAESGLFALGALPEGTVGPVRRRLAEIAGMASQSVTW